MLYLNNLYLTAEHIIARFEADVLNGAPPRNDKMPSALQRFKNKLDSIFKDSGLTADYPHLKHTLEIILLLDDSSNKAEALEQLKSIEAGDWNAAEEAPQFEQLNKRYGYFENVPENQQHALHELFKKLAVACRTMIVLFEQNNTPDDTMAYDYTYKLMALFLDPDKTIDLQKDFDAIAKKSYKLLTQGDSKKDKPFHDVLVVKLQLPDARDLADIAGWRAFVEKTGEKAFRFLSMAKKLEDKITEETGGTPRAPKDEKEAKSMAMLYCARSQTAVLDC